MGLENNLVINQCEIGIGLSLSPRFLKITHTWALLSDWTASMSTSSEEREYWPLVRVGGWGNVVWTDHPAVLLPCPIDELCDWWARFGHCFAREWLIWAPGQYVIDPIGGGAGEIERGRWLMSAIWLWQNQLGSIPSTPQSQFNYKFPGLHTPATQSITLPSECLPARQSSAVTWNGQFQQFI